MSDRLLISITKTAIKTVSIDFNEKGKTSGWIKMALLTDSGKEVSTTDYFFGKGYGKEFELPAGVETVMQGLARVLQEEGNKLIQGFDAMIETPTSPLPF